MEDSREIGRLRKYEWIGGLCFLAVYLSGVLSRLCSKLLPLISGSSDPVWRTMLLNLIMDGVALGFLLLLLRRYLAGQFRCLRYSGWQPLIQFLIGAFLMLLAMVAMGYLVGLVKSLYPRYSNGNQATADRLSSVHPVWTLVLTCAAAPVIEELLFRGVVFCGLWRHSAFWAYLLSALLFAFPHVSAYLFRVPALVTAVNMAVYFVFGLILARTYARSGTILTSILLHAAYNGFVQYLNKS